VDVGKKVLRLILASSDLVRQEKKATRETKK
jgi:hypothetical protein